jgi:hypothetical protein
MRRVVLGTLASGDSYVASDQEVDGSALSSDVWGSDGPPVLPSDGTVPTASGFFPPPGGVRVSIGSMPAGYGVTVGPPAGGPVSRADVHRRPNDPPGMHWTDSVDIHWILEGEIDVISDAGETRLRAGDWLVMTGARHGWANRSARPCRMLVIKLGAVPATE